MVSITSLIGSRITKKEIPVCINWRGRTHSECWWHRATGWGPGRNTKSNSFLCLFLDCGCKVANCLALLTPRLPCHGRLCPQTGRRTIPPFLQLLCQERCHCGERGGSAEPGENTRVTTAPHAAGRSTQSRANVRGVSSEPPNRKHPKLPSTDT